jgi:hypothetical protein
MSDGPIPDLRSLAEVEEPDVVKAALAAFRRRLWTRYVWVVVIAVAVAAAVVIVTRTDTLRDAIEGASSATIVRGSWEAGDVRIGLDRVASLDDGLGLHFVEIGPSRGSGSRPDTSAYPMTIEGSIETETWGMFDVYVEVLPPADRTIRVRVDGADCGGGPPCSFVVDLRDLGVQRTIWEGAGR